ncbi:MAG TPA: ATP-binding protein [Chloroflexota bacterium]|nr:ATP-binding protein [Chloroflexota bacterium]
MESELIDRELEAEELGHIAASRKPQLVLLYGRRRIGKTFLLDHIWTRDQAFYFLAADTTGQLNRQDLLRELSAWSGRSLRLEDFPTWRTVFRQLVEIARERPLVVILDEFQYLLGDEDDPASQLNAVWDREVRGAPITFVLCGSAVSTMEALNGAKAPLYGRITWAGQLRAFDYFDAATMVRTTARSSRELATLYGVFGGVPRYLAAVEAKDSLRSAVIRGILSPRGEVHLQLLTIIEQERGIRTPAEYRAVLSAIAKGNTLLNDIALAAGMAGRQREVRRILEVLQQLELIYGERNFAAYRTAPYRFRIADNALRFWYRFVEPNRSRLVRSAPAEVWSSLIRPYLNDYMGPLFETICRQGYLRFYQAWQLPLPVGEIGRWEGLDRQRQSVELDFVARVEGNRMLTGEIKWRTQAMAAREHYGVLDKLSRLAQSGHGWAADALSPNRSAGYIHFCAGGFGSDLLALAQSDSRIHLISLQELFAKRAPL